MSVDEINRHYTDTLRDLERSFPALLSEASRWPLKLRNRALHHVSEVRRVALAARILNSLSPAEENMSAMRLIGDLVNQSHQSLRDFYDVST